MPRQREVAAPRSRGPRGRSAPAALASSPASAEARTPAAQMTVLAGEVLAVVLALERDAVRVDARPRRCAASASRRAAQARALPRATATAGRSAARGRPPPRAGSAPAAGRSRGSRAAACRARSRAICPAISTPVGPAPTTTKVSRAPPASGPARARPSRRRAGSARGVSSALSSDFTSGGDARSIRHGRSRSRSSRRRRSACRSRACPARARRRRHRADLARLEVESRHLGQHHAHVLRPVKIARSEKATSPCESAPVATW